MGTEPTLGVLVHGAWRGAHAVPPRPHPHPLHLAVAWVVRHPLLVHRVQGLAGGKGQPGITGRAGTRRRQGATDRLPALGGKLWSFGPQFLNPVAMGPKKWITVLIKITPDTPRSVKLEKTFGVAEPNRKHGKTIKLREGGSSAPHPTRVPGTSSPCAWGAGCPERRPRGPGAAAGAQPRAARGWGPSYCARSRVRGRGWGPAWHWARGPALARGPAAASLPWEGPESTWSVGPGAVQPGRAPGRGAEKGEER